MKHYVVFDEYGNKSLRKGTIHQSDSGLYYFAADYRNAKLYTSIPRYKMTGSVSEFLKFVDYRRKNNIDSPADESITHD